MPLNLILCVTVTVVTIGYFKGEKFHPFYFMCLCSTFMSALAELKVLFLNYL